jgi:HEAT repeat protein
MVTPGEPLLGEIEGVLEGHGPASRLAAYLGALSGAGLVGLSQTLRNRHGLVGARWGRLDQAEAARLIGASAGPALAVLLSMHRSGWVRAEAVRALAECGDELATKALLLRVDDIVGEIRAAASAALVPRMNAQNAAAFMALAPVVQTLARRTRAAQGGALSGLVGFLSSPSCRGALEEALSSPDPGVRAAAFRWLLEGADSDERRIALLGRAFADPDASLSRSAAREIASTRSSAAVLGALLPRLEAHRSAEYRRRAVQARGRSGDLAAVQRALLDRSSDVRFAARDRLRLLGWTEDLRLLYRAALDRNPSRRALIGVIAGLGEVGSGDEDLPLLWGFLASKDPGLRAAAVRAIGQLGGDLTRIEPSLRDPSSRVRHQARQALGQLG